MHGEKGFTFFVHFSPYYTDKFFNLLLLGVPTKESLRHYVADLHFTHHFRKVFLSEEILILILFWAKEGCFMKIMALVDYLITAVIRAKAQVGQASASPLRNKYF